MTTQREQILTAVVTLLLGNTPAGSNVFRSRSEALARGELPAIVIKPGAEDVDNTARGIAQRSFEVQVQVFARGTPADQIADPVVLAAHVLLMTEQTLGGKMARLIEKGTAEPDFADGDDTAVMIQTTYVARYATPAGDLTRQI